MPAEYPPEAWLLFALIAGGAIIAMLWVFAALLEHQLTLHDLRVRALRLRMEYMRRLKALQGDPADDEPILAITEEGDAGVEQPSHRSAA